MKTCTMLIAAMFAALTATADVTFRHIRNATARITYGKTTFLVDPMLAEKGRYPGFPDCFNQEVRNPKLELPCSVDEILEGVDAVIVTHTHLDHWDEVAQKVIRKDITVFAQDETDAAAIKAQGFTDVRAMKPAAEFGGVRLTHISGTHGTAEMYDVPDFAKGLGESMGVVFSAPREKTVYLAGDTVWTPRVSKTLFDFKPDIVVLNTGYAKVLAFNDSMIMGTEDVAKAARLAPLATIVAVHMDAISHCTVSRKNMREFVRQAGLDKRVKVPEDGETLKLK